MTVGDFVAENNGKSLSSYFAWLARYRHGVSPVPLFNNANPRNHEFYSQDSVYIHVHRGGCRQHKKKRGVAKEERESEKKLNKYPTGKEIFLFEL